MDTETAPPKTTRRNKEEPFMKIAVITRAESDLLDALKQNAEVTVFSPAAATDLDSYDAVAILGGTQEEPLTLPIDTRLAVENARAQGKRVFAEWCTSIGSAYYLDDNIPSCVFGRMVWLTQDGPMPAGALLDARDNRFLRYLIFHDDAVPCLGFGGHITKHDCLEKAPDCDKMNWTLWYHDPGTLVCALRLCHFVRARFAPAERWNRLVAFIITHLTGCEATVKTVPPVCTDNPVLPPHKTFAAGLRWFDGANILLKNGEDGAIEGLRHNIRPDGSQLIFETVRNDCSGEVGGAYFFDWLLHKDKGSLQRFRNLQKFCFEKMQIKEGLHRGMMRWTTVAWTTCYQDDVARAILGTLLQMQLTGDRQYLPEVCAALDYLLQTTGTDGLRISRTDIPNITPERIHELRETPADFPCAHHNGSYMAVLLMTYRLTGRQEYFDTACRGLKTLMRAFPDTIREHSETQELCRLILPLAVLYEITGSEQHRTWLYTVCDALEAFRHESGGYLEYDTGYRAARSRTSGTESSLLADNGDPVTDLLYSTNWLPLAFAVAYKVTNDPVFKERWQSLATFLSRTQMRSADPLLDGCWCRGMDVARMEAYGMPHDVGWGPCSVESGWTVGEILMGLGYGMYLHMDE